MEGEHGAKYLTYIKVIRHTHKTTVKHFVQEDSTVVSKYSKAALLHYV